MDSRAQILAAVNAANWNEVRQLASAEPALAAIRDDAGVSLTMMLAYRGANELAGFVASHLQIDVFEATTLGDIARLAQILAATPDAVNSLSADGWTALHLAGFFGQVEAAKLLLARGASISVYGSNYMRNMPLHAALSGAQNQALVSLLLDHGANVNATGATGITPLHLAASRGNQALIDLLLAKGADKLAKMDNGQQPADLARERGHPAVAEALAQTG